MKGVYRLEIGDEAPDFTLPATGLTAGKGQDRTTITLSAFRGKRNVVLAFFPAAWTPV
jgi:peroxiredoxin